MNVNMEQLMDINYLDIDHEDTLRDMILSYKNYSQIMYL